MKIKILKPCTTPEGSHQPGDTVETSDRSGEYLIANGYAQPANAKQAPETAESKTPKENAARKTK
jgi:hypothetical protein